MEKVFEKIIERLEEVERKLLEVSGDIGCTMGIINAMERARRIVNKVAEESENDRCKWYYTYSDEENIFDTDCGEGFYFESGGVGEDGFKYCPYCGRLIKVMPDDQEGE